jgi:hypothetical protein
MFVRWLLIASVVLVALSAFFAGVNASDFAHAFYAGVNASDFAYGHQGSFIVGVFATLTGLLSAIRVIWNNYLVRGVLIASVVLVAPSAFFFGVFAHAHGYQGLSTIGVQVIALAVLLSAFSVIWNNYPPKDKR